MELKAEISRQQKENEKLVDKAKSASEDVKRLEHQVNRLIGKPLDDLEKREEGELFRENKIQEQERLLQEKEAREHELSEQIFKNDYDILDLKFQKETFDLQFARLQKRITDLELYKLNSAKFSAVIKKNEDKEQERIDEGGVTQAKKQ